MLWKLPADFGCAFGFLLRGKNVGTTILLPSRSRLCWDTSSMWQAVWGRRNAQKATRLHDRRNVFPCFSRTVFRQGRHITMQQFVWRRRSAKVHNLWISLGFMQHVARLSFGDQWWQGGSTGFIWVRWFDGFVTVTLVNENLSQPCMVEVDQIVVSPVFHCQFLISWVMRLLLFTDSRQQQAENCVLSVNSLTKALFCLYTIQIRQTCVSMS